MEGKREVVESMHYYGFFVVLWIKCLYGECNSGKYDNVARSSPNSRSWFVTLLHFY